MKPLSLLKDVSLLGCCMVYRQATYVCPQGIPAVMTLMSELLLIKQPDRLLGILNTNTIYQPGYRAL
jgi:hypothetical protein